MDDYREKTETLLGPQPANAIICSAHSEAASSPFPYFSPMKSGGCLPSLSMPRNGYVNVWSIQ